MVLPISQGGGLVKELFMENYLLEIRYLGSICQNIQNQLVTEVILHVDVKHV